MLWKIYTVVFFLINAISVIVFDYRSGDWITIIGLALSAGLNIAVFSYAFKKEILPKPVLVWLFKLNVALIGLFVLFEVITFFQEIIGSFISLPTSGVISMIASVPSLPALYATYKLAHPKNSKSKQKSKR